MFEKSPWYGRGRNRLEGHGHWLSPSVPSSLRGAVFRFCKGIFLGPWPPFSGTLASGMAAALDLKSKEEKDAELDKRIEALRRKNEALIRRYQVP